MEDYRLEQSGQEVQDILNGAAMQSDLTAETERATEAEQTLQGNIDAEERDRKAADVTLQGNIDAEELRAKAAEKQNADDIDALEEKVPSGASASNKLATESYVEDAVSTATATFRGTYNLVSDLHLTVNATEQQIATALALAISTADNNDYCFVQVPTSSETPTEIKEIDRYKFNGTAWSFEYKLNNSGFTAAQWAAINSGITSGDVSKLAALPTNAELTTLLNGKQDVLTFDNVPTEGSSHPVKSGGVYSAIDDEKTAREGADSSLSSAIEAILLLIPSAATSLNKLADKSFVNSSIATASATFRGTYNLVTDLSLTVSATHAQIATALAGAVSDEDNNDYAFVQIPTSDATPTQIAKTERYKFNGTAWEYEYDLNNSGYTAAQWAAINSGITEALVTKLSALPTNAELTSALGVLTSSITTINQKIPSAASQANQLVDTAAMESYIVQVLDVLTASFNVTSTDGHVTVSISQVDGKITSVSVSTSDIASASDLSLIAGRVTTAEGNISTNAADIANLQDAYAALTQSALVIVQPSDTWPVASPATKTIYRVVDRVNTPPQNYSDYMGNGTAMVLMATYDNAIDDEPTPGSNNLVKSGGIFKSYGKKAAKLFTINGDINSIFSELYIPEAEEGDYIYKIFKNQDGYYGLEIKNANYQKRFYVETNIEDDFIGIHRFKKDTNALITIDVQWIIANPNNIVFTYNNFTGSYETSKLIVENVKSKELNPVSSALNGIVGEFKNIEIPDSAVTDGGYWHNGRLWTGADYSYIRISVKENEVYRVSGVSDWDARLVELDNSENSRLLEYPSTGADAQQMTHTVYVFNGAKYLYTNFLTKYRELVKIEKFCLFEDESESLKWGVIGDSLSAVTTLPRFKSYVEYITEAFGFTTTNMAISGTGYLKTQSNFDNITNDMQGEYDLITIFGSFNDLYKSAEQGGGAIDLETFGDEDSTDHTTIAGCIYNTIQHIRSKYPKARLGIIAPTPWADVNNVSPNIHLVGYGEKYVSLLEAMCRKYCVAFLDLYHFSGMYPWISEFNSLYFKNADGCHPNSAGHLKFIYPQVRDFIKKLL